MLKFGLIAGYHCIKLMLNSGVLTGWQKGCFKRNQQKLLLLNHAMKLMLICGLNNHRKLLATFSHCIYPLHFNCL